jgi:addiction module RelB/DinJ family antitoxin
MANSYIQVRVDDSDKEKAGEILDGLGTNLSMVVNMLLKQIIMTEGIPFEIKMNKANNRDEILSELRKALSDEPDMSEEEVKLLERYKKASKEEKEAIRRVIMNENITD